MLPLAACAVAVMGGIVVIAGSALPWIETGGRQRSAFTLIRVIHDLDVLETTRQRIAVSSLLAVPVLIPLAVVLLASGWRRCAAAAVGVGALIGLVAGGIGTRFSGTGLPGPIVTLVGAILALGAVLTALMAGRRDRSDRSSHGHPGGTT